jgi:hypothetical protein
LKAVASGDMLEFMGGNGLDGRLAFLEMVFLEDRSRWKRNDDRFETLLRAVIRQDERMGKRHRRMAKLESRIDASLRILRRRAER